jgi:hypothetical protein
MAFTLNHIKISHTNVLHKTPVKVADFKPRVKLENTDSTFTVSADVQPVSPSDPALPVWTSGQPDTAHAGEHKFAFPAGTVSAGKNYWLIVRACDSKGCVSTQIFVPVILG